MNKISIAFRSLALPGLWMIALLLGVVSDSLALEPRPAEGVAGEKTITLNMQKGDIADALRLVAEQGGLNLVIGPEVKGEVSVYLTEASLETALRAITVNNGFAYSVEDGVISVSRPAPTNPGDLAQLPPRVSRVFNLRCVDAERVKAALEHALSRTPDNKSYGQITVLNQNSDQTYGVQRLSSLGGDLNTGGSGSPDQFSTSGQATNRGALGTSGAPGVFGNAAVGADGLAPPRNARTLIVTDTEESVQRIAELIADVDKLPPQVLIEARIVEMSTDLQRQLGIEWNVNALANGPILNHQWPLNNRAGFASGSQIMRRSDGTPYNIAGLALGSVDFSRFTLLLEANQNDNAIRLLANPRLLVYNNHSASILVGERYPILQASVSNFGTVTEAFQTYIPVGVQLEVTPTIMMDGKISLLVHPATSALGEDVVGTTGLRVARIRTRELDTRVIMGDGDTIVLGGLISDRKVHSANKIPGLGDLPVLDIFFRQENPRADRVDLLIFLTAHIEAATQISERDERVYEMYKPHFKHVERLQDVPLHFEVPTEYEPPRPMFSDPPGDADFEESESAPQAPEKSRAARSTQPKRPQAANEAAPAETAPPAFEPRPARRVQANGRMRLDSVRVSSVDGR